MEWLSPLSEPGALWIAGRFRSLTSRSVEGLKRNRHPVMALNILCSREPALGSGRTSVGSAAAAAAAGAGRKVVRWLISTVSPR